MTKNCIIKILSCSLSLLPFAQILGCGGDAAPTGTTGGTPSSGSWTTRTIDSIGVVGEYTSIAVDDSARPHISYLNRDSGSIMYARWTGTSWSKQAVADARGPILTKGRSSIALDGTRKPRITFHKADVAYFYTYSTGSAWTSPSAILFSQSAWAFLDHNSIAVNKSTGVTHVSLWYFDNNGYLLAYWSPGMNSAQVVDGYYGLTGKNNSIAVDASGDPHISYEASDAASNTLLKYAHRVGSTWQLSVVDTIQTTEGFASLTSIAVDATNRPHIAYYSHRGGAYKYARWNGTSWEISTVDTYGSVGWEDVDIALDGNGNPHIAYLASSYKLKYARRTGSSWTLETVDNRPGVGFNCSIAAAANGSVHVSYFDDTNANLVYATRSP